MVAIPSKFSIVFETEPLVKLRCADTDCLHNLCNKNKNGWLACNLKHIDIGLNGRCQKCQYELKGANLE